MMSDFSGDGGSEMTPKNRTLEGKIRTLGGSEMTQKNRTLEGKNRTLGGEGGSKIVKNRRTSLMDVPFQ